MKVTNQKPVMLSPVYQAKIQGDFDPLDYIAQTLATPLYTPVVAGQPVTISANGVDITPADIAQTVANCCGDVVDTTSEAWCKAIFGKTLVYFDKNSNLLTQNLFAIQAAEKEKLPTPTATIVYTPATDVIPVSKEFLAGKCDYEKYFATLAFYARPNTLGFYFANETAFDSFKFWLSAQTAAIAAGLPAQTNQLLQDFQNLNLNGLTESLVLRNNDAENNDEYSFARTLIAYMMQYATQVSSAEFGVLPFELGELYCPRSIVLVNVEKHAHATARQVADEWNLINQSLSMKINMVSNNKLNRLTATARNLSKIQGMAATAATNSSASTSKSANVKFRKTAPNTIDIAKLLNKIMNKMAAVNRSENTYKSVKMTFAKPNRRDPDDFNKQGKSVSVKYRPDIHLYIDTSGSISEENYQDAVKACIQMARKLNINLYFNSFSHCMSQCTKLNVKDKSARQVYAAFRNVPKVTGGTDYAQIWNYINRSKKRKREISLIITDFEWHAPNRYIEHPKNLYYIPCSRCDWKGIVSSAESFCKSMMHIDPDCRRHLLF